MTNGLVNGGRWLVAAIFAIEGVTTVWSSFVTRLIDGLSGLSWGETGSFFLLYARSMSSLTLLLCAWGIFNWRVWARYVALFLSALDFVGAVAGFYFVSWSRTNVALALAIVLNSAILIWLLLPSVRAEYARKALTA